MKLNFWTSFSSLIVFNICCLATTTVILLPFYEIVQIKSFKLTTDYIYFTFFAGYCFWYSKKTGIILKDSFFTPNISSIIKMLIIVLLARLIVLPPLDNTIRFLELLHNFELKIISTAINPKSFSYSLNTILISPIIEEIFFRGLLLHNFLSKYSPIKAILLSSILFGIHHFWVMLNTFPTGFYNFPFFIVIGMVFGILYYSTKSLILASLAHIIFNVFVLLKNQLINLDKSNAAIYLFTYIVSYLILAFLLNKSFKSGDREYFLSKNKK